MSTVTQLRVLTIQPGHLNDFVDAWKKTILPLRSKHGFLTDQAWTIPEVNEFIWILRFSGPGSWDETDEAYYQDLIHSRLEPDVLRYIDRVERWFLQPVEIDLSPPIGSAG